MSLKDNKTEANCVHRQEKDKKKTETKNDSSRKTKQEKISFDI